MLHSREINEAIFFLCVLVLFSNKIASKQRWKKLRRSREKSCGSGWLSFPGCQGVNLAATSFLLQGWARDLGSLVHLGSCGWPEIPGPEIPEFFFVSGSEGHCCNFSLSLSSMFHDRHTHTDKQQNKSVCFLLVLVGCCYVSGAICSFSFLCLFCYRCRNKDRKQK